MLTKGTHSYQRKLFDLLTPIFTAWRNKSQLEMRAAYWILFDDHVFGVITQLFVVYLQS